MGPIGAEPQRAKKIAFSPAYVEIASTFLVGPSSSLQSIGDVDKPGIRDRIHCAGQPTISGSSATSRLRRSSERTRSTGPTRTSCR